MFSWFHRKLEGFIVSTMVIVLMFWETFTGFALGYALCFTCCFHEFSHQLSLTRFICLLVCERMAGAPFIPQCSMVLDVDLDAYRKASNADAELGAFTFF